MSGVPDAAALEAALPPPADDDPPGLRAAIADELADHLACAAAREAAAGRPAAETAARVLDRFGDPRRLAVRLFLDATKGSRLMQRFTLGLSAATLALVGFALWQSSSANAELANAVAALRESVRNPPPADVFSDVTVRVRSRNGRPLEGYGVELTTDSVGEFGFTGTSDAEGVAISRRMPGGVIVLYASHPFGWTTQENRYLVEPGRPLSIDLVAPDPAAVATVRLDNRLRLDSWDGGSFVERVRTYGDDAARPPSPAEVGVRVDAGAIRRLKSGDMDVLWVWRAGEAQQTPRIALTTAGGGPESNEATRRTQRGTSQNIRPGIDIQGRLFARSPWYASGLTTLKVPAGELVVTASAPAAKFASGPDGDDPVWFRLIGDSPALEGWQRGSRTDVGFRSWSVDVASIKRPTLAPGEEVTLPVAFGEPADG